MTENIEQTMPTKSQFFAALETELKRLYQWSKDEKKLSRYMDEVKRSLSSEVTTVITEGPAFTQALVSIGLPPKVKMAELRKLPD